MKDGWMDGMKEKGRNKKFFLIFQDVLGVANPVHLWEIYSLI